MAVKPKRLSQIDLDQLITELPVANGPPTNLHELKRHWIDILTDLAAHDCLSYSIWQSKTSTEIWIHMTGGIAGVDVWYGPGEFQLIEALPE